jgi:tetrapyrrole methylase family protein/MazG family protein
MDINIDEANNSNDPLELFDFLLKMMAALRSPKGCVWDREQSHESIKKNLIEEAYEAAEAIDNKEPDFLKEELGDVMLQVVFHSQIAEEKNEFDISDVLKEIINKLYRRHPHVFGDKVFSNSKEVLLSWEEIKKTERKKNPKKTQSIFNDIPKIMPSLHSAFEIQNRASRFGFDWDDEKGVIEKIKEEISELEAAIVQRKKFEDADEEDKRIKDCSTQMVMMEIGDLLFSIVNLSRHLKIDCEEALKMACEKFVNRFNAMEKLALKKKLDFKTLTLEEKDKLWDEIKENEKK